MKISPHEISQHLANENPHYKAGIIARLQNNTDEAIRCFNAAGDHAESLYMLGVIKEEIATPESKAAARQHYEAAAAKGHRPAKARLEAIEHNILEARPSSPVADRNPLHNAVITGIPLPTLRIDNVRQLDSKGRSPFHYVVLQGNPLNTHDFLKWDASLRPHLRLKLLEFPTATGETAFHLAAAQGHYDLLHVWLEGEQDLATKIRWLTMLDSTGLTPLHHALSSRKEDPRVLLLLVQHGAQINPTTPHYISCLHYAIQHPWSDHYNIRYCLIAGSDRFTPSLAGATPSLQLDASPLLSDTEKMRLKDSIAPMAAEQQMDLSITALIFQGGGAKGLAYCGAIDALAKADVLQRVNKVGGASAGSITATILGIGCNADEIVKLQSADFNQFKDKTAFLKGWLIADLDRLIRQGGFYQGDFLRLWIDVEITKKLGHENATFMDLHRKVLEQDQSPANLDKPYRFRDIYIAVTNVSRSQVEYWSWENEPDTAIADAVRASVAIPGFFAALSVQRNRKGILMKDANDRLALAVDANPERLVDGGVLDNYPVKIFDQSGVPNLNTLGFKLVEQKDIASLQTGQARALSNTSWFYQYWGKLATTVALEQQTSAHFHSADQFRTVYLDTCGVGTTEFDLNNPTKQEKKAQLIDSAERATREYLLRRYEMMNVVRQTNPTPHEQLLRWQHLERKQLFQKSDHVCAGQANHQYVIQLIFSLIKCNDPLKSVRKYAEKLKLQSADIKEVTCYQQQGTGNFILQFKPAPDIFNKFYRWAKKYNGCNPAALIDTRSLTLLCAREYGQLAAHINLSTQYFYACEAGNTQRITELLSEGIAIDFVDREGNNALYYAVRANKREVIRFLVSHHVTDFGHRNVHGQSAWDIATPELRAFINTLAQAPAVGAPAAAAAAHA